MNDNNDNDAGENKETYNPFEEKPLAKFLMEPSKDKSEAFKYEPFQSNAILTVGNNVNEMYVLLKNGLIIKWGNCDIESKKAFKKIKGDIMPKVLKCPVKLVNLVCGKNHCLAVCPKYTLYSWGSNSHGQLGIPGYPIDHSSYKTEPMEVPTLRESYLQIFAFNNNSFAIDDEGVFYGWGSVSIVEII